MPLADSKKAATIRNLWYSRVAGPVLEADAAVAAIRAAIVQNSLLGEFSVAERDAMQAVETSLNSLAALGGITATEGKYQPTHRAQAITIEGVND